MTRPARGLGVNYLIKLLVLLKTDHRSNELAKASPLRLRKSHFAYLNWCIKKGFVSKDIIYEKRFSKTSKKPMVIYGITWDGRKLLEVIS